MFSREEFEHSILPDSLLSAKHFMGGAFGKPAGGIQNIAVRPRHSLTASTGLVQMRKTDHESVPKIWP